MIWRLWVQAPLGEIFDKFILFCVTLDLSDNLTQMRQTGLSWKTQLTKYIFSLMRNQSVKFYVALSLFSVEWWWKGTFRKHYFIKVLIVQKSYRYGCHVISCCYLATVSKVKQSLLKSVSNGTVVVRSWNLSFEYERKFCTLKLTLKVPHLGWIWCLRNWWEQ